MRKNVNKLVIRRETLQRLADNDQLLQQALGGVVTSSPVTWCTSYCKKE